MKAIWLFFLFPLLALAEPNAELLGHIVQSPPCEGHDLLSDAFVRKIAVPAVCVGTQDYLARVKEYDEQIRSDCRITSAQYSARIREAASCERINLNGVEHLSLSGHQRQLKEAGRSLHAEMLSAQEAKIAGCSPAHEEIQLFAFRQMNLVDHYYGILNYSVEDACGSPGAQEYMDFLEKGES